MDELVTPVQPLNVSYVNYRGERSLRHIRPASVIFGTNGWHKEPTWLLYAFDVDKGKFRSFDMRYLVPQYPPHPLEVLPQPPDVSDWLRRTEKEMGVAFYADVVRLEYEVEKLRNDLIFERRANSLLTWLGLAGWFMAIAAPTAAWMLQ